MADTVPDTTLRSGGRRNRQAVLREILLSGPLARAEIAGRIGLSAAAVSRIARTLIDAGLVHEKPEERNDRPARPGRRFMPLHMDPAGGQVLGIEIAPSFQTVTLADITNETIAATVLELETIADPDDVIRRLARESRRLIGAHLEDRSSLLGSLLMIDGSVDAGAGYLRDGPYLGWGALPVRARFADVLDLPMKVRPLTPSIALAELLFGEARGRSNVLTLVCGLGVGAAVVLGGRLVEDDSLSTGGIGAMAVTGEDGNAGTLDDLGSGFSVLRHLHGEDMTPTRVPQPQMARALFDALEREQAGDAKIEPLTSRAGRELGRVVVQFARFIRLDAVLIAGPLSLSPGYMAGASEAVSEGSATHPVEVLRGGITGLVGDLSASCAMAVWEYLIERPSDLASLGAGRT